MLNCIVLMGRFTADPELKHTPNNTAVTEFRLAVDRSYIKSGQERQTDFIDIVAWRSNAEFICKHFKKDNSQLSRDRFKLEAIPIKMVLSAEPPKYWPTAFILPGLKRKRRQTKEISRTICRRTYLPRVLTFWKCWTMICLFNVKERGDSYKRKARVHGKNSTCCQRGNKLSFLFLYLVSDPAFPFHNSIHFF